jgi:hypothetical protein
VNHAGDDLALPLQRDRDREDRDAVQEVGRAVERIDDPAMLGVVARHLAALLHQEGVTRPRLDSSAKTMSSALRSAWLT